MRSYFALASVAVASAAMAGESVQNGSFESAQQAGPARVAISNLTDWDASGGFMLLEQGVNGTSNIAAHTGTQFVSMGHNGSLGDTLSQVVDTQAGASYEVEFYLHVIQGNTVQELVGEAFQNGTQDSLGSVDTSMSSTTQGWVRWAFSFTAASELTELRFVHTAATGSGNIAIDSVAMTPAPASAAMLALGGLFATRRRR